MLSRTRNAIGTRECTTAIVSDVCIRLKNIRAVSHNSCIETVLDKPNREVRKRCFSQQAARGAISESKLPKLRKISVSVEVGLGSGLCLVNFQNGGCT